jgi:type I restriction enzyme R subunit
LDASPTLRSKKDLIEDFVDTISLDGSVEAEWQAFIAGRQEAELNTIIAEESLKPEETRRFISRAFKDGTLRTSGTAITRVLPPVSRFSKDHAHSAKKHRVIEKLTAYFNRFLGLSQGNREE